MEYKILMTDCIFKDDQIEKSMLKKINAELVHADSIDEETLASLVSDIDGMLVTYAKIPKLVIDAANKCKIIVKTGIGYDNIDVTAATKKGIMVANVPDYCITEVAEHTIALIFNCIRKITYYSNAIKGGVWDMNIGRPIHRINKIKLGLYGFGNIAQKVALLAQAFGMRVMSYDPYVGDSVFKKANVNRVSHFTKFISCVDILSLHAPLTKENLGVINYDVFLNMKKTSYLINTSRGGLVNENDLCDAISKGEILGCGIDVMETEYGNLKSPLLKYENVYITPHVAFYSEESDIELRTKSVEQIILALTQGEPKYFVNRNSLR